MFVFRYTPGLKSKESACTCRGQRHDDCPAVASSAVNVHSDELLESRVDSPVDLLTSRTLPNMEPQDVEDSSAQPESGSKQAATTLTAVTGEQIDQTQPIWDGPFYSFRGHGGYQAQMLQLFTDLQKCITAAKAHFVLSYKEKETLEKVSTCHDGLTRVLTESSSERATWSQDSYGL